MTKRFETSSISLINNRSNSLMWRVRLSVSARAQKLYKNLRNKARVGRGLFSLFYSRLFHFNYILLWNSFPFSVKFVRNNFRDSARASTCSLRLVFNGLFLVYFPPQDLKSVFSVVWTGSAERLCWWHLWVFLFFFFFEMRIILQHFAPLCHELFHASSWAWNSSWRFSASLCVFISNFYFLYCVFLF